MKSKKIYAVSIVLGMVIGMCVPFASADETVAQNEIEPIAIVDETFSSENEPESTVNGQVLFTDVPQDSWYYPYVVSLADGGIVKGTSDTTFSPNGTFTVAEAATVITRYLGLEEEANKRAEAMKILSVAGSEKWYAGYVQLMYEAGIIDVETYGCTVLGRHISIDDPSLLEQPVKRYEFAAFVTRSFELDGTEIRSTVGEGLGHEFIFGGAYDESILEHYIPYIQDYAEIPESYSYYILKAYYNGIFNGDENGNFNPANNLSRAEMAKVAAVIIDASLRTRIDVSAFVPQSSPLPEDSFIVSDGISYLKNSVSDTLLEKEKSSISVFYENNIPYVSYVPEELPPSGFSYRLYHFTKDKSGYDFNICVNHEQNTEYKSPFASGDTLVLVLCNNETTEAVDAISMTLIGVNAVESNDCRYMP